MAGRKSTGKRQRFEIFQRDGFRCQYCGGQPPDVVLVVDHVIPVADGGPNTPENLVTSCEPCNQGKSDRTLNPGMLVNGPDASLLYLQAQQEIAELRAYQAAQAEKEEVLSDLCRDMAMRYFENSGHQAGVSELLIRRFLNKYEPEIVEDALLTMAIREASGHRWVNPEHFRNYAWFLMRHSSEESSDEVHE